jgi:glycosyltransferase involved in cell wall biosynthesis
MKVTSASILICTYNRAELLRETLAALQALHQPPHCDVEIVIVDNNSSDETPLVIAEAAQRPGIPIVSAWEVKQGKSFALNLGLTTARGDIIALTDDDVWPDPEWLVRIVADFRTRDVTFVFGKVLPRWGRQPPPEILTTRADCIWGPLAIVDYGDVAATYLPDCAGQRLPIGANLAFTRRSLCTIGGWRTDLGKVNGSLISGEDHEIFMRLRRHEMYVGYYDPAVVVRHFVPAERLTRSYFRRWFFWHGKTNALMLAELYPELEMGKVPRVGGIPRFLFRQGFEQWRKWVWSLVAGDALDVLIEELRSLRYAGLMYECWRRRKLSGRLEPAECRP